MGRWRPPQTATSAYITATGFATLQLELKELWQKRAAVVQALAAAAAEGDRSENAEYIYRKKELAGIDRRIRYLQKRLPKLQVVREFAARDQVFFGAWVELHQDDDSCHEYRIVGPDEADPSQRLISMDSPLARALRKKSVGDEVRIDVNGETTVFRISRIRYEA